MFKAGDRIVVRDTGEVGVVTESLGMDCYLVMLEGWPEACQVNGRQLDRLEGIGMDMDAYHEGWEAAIGMQPKEDCPYRLGTVALDSWQQGWYIGFCQGL